MKIELIPDNTPTKPGYYFFQAKDNKHPVFVRVEQSADKTFLYVSTKKQTSEDEFPLAMFSKTTRWSGEIEFFNRE